MTEFYAGLDVSDKTIHICAVNYVNNYGNNYGDINYGNNYGNN
jgi:hypothetical protein